MYTYLYLYYVYYANQLEVCASSSQTDELINTVSNTIDNVLCRRLLKHPH